MTGYMQAAIFLVENRTAGHGGCRIVRIVGCCTAPGTHERRVPVKEFCTAPGVNVLGRGELLVALELPAPEKGFGAAYQRFIPRNEMDIAVAGVGTAFTLDEDSANIVSGRIALAAVGPRPVFAAKASAFLAGKPATPETFAEAGEIASTEATPIGDMRGTAEHRIELVKVLTRRRARPRSWRTASCGSPAS